MTTIKQCRNVGSKTFFNPVFIDIAKSCLFLAVSTFNCPLQQGRREEGGRGEAKYLGPGLVRGGRNLGKTSDHGCDCQQSWGPVKCNHLLVLGPDPGSCHSFADLLAQDYCDEAAAQFAVIVKLLCHST